MRHMALKSMARWVVLGALFIIPFIPLYVATDLFFPFISGKAFLFRILVELAAGAWVLLALADKAYRPRFSWTFVLYAAFTLWMFIADLFAVNPHKAFWSNYERMDGWVTMIHVFLFFVVAGSVLSADKLWKRWWQTVLGASVLVSIYGLWQVFGLTEIHQGGVRADASFGNAIYLAVYLLFTIGIAAWQAIESRGWLRYAYSALIAVQLVIVFATATRGVILGVFGAAGLVALLYTIRTTGKTRNIAIATLVALIALGGIFFLARDSAFIRSEPTLTRIASIFDSHELATRSTLWGMALQGALARPVTGWGQEGYNYVFNTYYHPSLYAQEAWFDRAHNTYLDWLVAGGFPGLFLFLALMGVAVFAIYNKDTSRAERILLLGILAGYVVQAVSAFDNLFSYILLAAILAMAHDRSARPIPFIERQSALTGSALSAIALPVVLVATLGSLWVVNIPGMQAGGDLIRAASTTDAAGGLAALTQASKRGSFATQEITEQTATFAGNVLADPSVAVPEKQQVFAFASTLMQQELTRAPRDARLHVMYAQLLRGAGDAPDSLTEITTALSLSPKKQAILFQRGIGEWQGGDKASAANDFETAYQLDTNYQQAAAYAAAGHFITGDMAGGNAVLQQVYGTTTVDADILRFAYYDLKRYDLLIASVKANLAQAPEDPQRQLLLAQTYILSGQYAAARAQIQTTIAAHPEAATAGNQMLQSISGK